MTMSTTTQGEITSDAIYTLQEIEERLRLGKGALRTARRNGLVVKKIGRRSFVRGSDLLDYFDQHAKRVA